MPSTTTSRKHLLTVLVEDYFQVGAFERLIQEKNWSNFVPRYEQNTLKALDLLDEYRTKGTFFVLGWIADQNPSLVKEIALRGHEVASRGYFHRNLGNLTPQEFREDLIRTNRAIENATGEQVLGYRAAEKLSINRDKWILEVLAEEGIVYDASMMPSLADEPEDRFEHEIKLKNGSIYEFPFSTLNVGVGLLPISGGNYLRQMPHTLLKHAISQWDRKFDSPFMFYFHVWELDPEQPRISAASYYNRVRHYRKLDKMEWVIKENLLRYDYCGIAEHLGLNKASVGRFTENIDSNVLRPKAIPDQTTQPLTDVTIVIPCFNESESLPYLANTLRKLEAGLSDLNFSPRFIFVDDSSIDNTSETLEKLFGAMDNVTIIRHQKNLGVAGAISTGIRSAETELVCSMDCDCTYDPMELLAMLPAMTREVDMVTASPYHPDGIVRNVPGWRLILSKGASFLYKQALNSQLSTFTSCFRVYRRSSVLPLVVTETGFLGVAEMLGQLHLNGGTIREHPAALEVRLFGFSKMKTVKTIAGHIRLLAKLGKVRITGKSQLISTSTKIEDHKT